MEYKTREEGAEGTCLECGNVLYGRTDKKFCDESCRNRYHTRRHAESTRMKRRVIAALDGNYRILTEVLSSGKDSAELSELEAAGFKPGVISGHTKYRGHDEYRCYEIRYVRTPTRIMGIRKITVL